MIDDYKVIEKKLGNIYSKEETIFRLWSPLRDQVSLLLYKDNNNEYNKYEMVKGEDGVHKIVIKGDLKNYFYSYLIDNIEVTDPYCRASSLNSKKSAIVDLRETNPRGWENHRIPSIGREKAIIYEVHIKDFTGHPSSKVKNRGKYLGMIEKIHHLKELGVTHIHLMPIYDFITVDEENDKFYLDDNYNWGYDPELYNLPEGSYASDSTDPSTRIRELKELIMALHENGFKVIMDVVYNHTYKSYDSNFNIIMPNYYYRQDSHGGFSNGSGCGNEIASERPMVRKFIIDSLTYWVEEYKIDGFRFDLMALMDIETMTEITDKLRTINPQIFIYGEPWTGGHSSLPHHMQTDKGKVNQLNISSFNDDFRDAIKGDNDDQGGGFVQGNIYFKDRVKTGIAGGFTKEPLESINYVNSHDNLILWDKLVKSCPTCDRETLIKLNKLALGILFTCQGIPFIHGGNEFLRSKQMHHNTYNLPLSINGIDWTLKEENYEFFSYVRDLIAFRKSYPVLSMKSKEEILSRIRFIDIFPDLNFISYILRIDEDKSLLIIHNGERSDLNFRLKDYNLDQGKIIFDERGLRKEKGLIDDCIYIPDLTTLAIEVVEI